MLPEIVMKILVLNPGSSSMKSATYAMPGEERVTEAAVDAVGIRVVHGGSRFETPAVVDDAVLDEIRKLSALAPLHNPLAVKTIEDVRRERNGVPIVAVFDTAFHRTLPDVAALPLPTPEPSSTVVSARRTVSAGTWKPLSDTAPWLDSSDTSGRTRIEIRPFASTVGV